MQDCDPKRRETNEVSLIIILVFWLEAFFRLCCRKFQWVEENEFGMKRYLEFARGQGWVEKELQKYPQDSPWVRWGQFLDYSTGWGGARNPNRTQQSFWGEENEFGVGEAKGTRIKIAEFRKWRSLETCIGILYIFGQISVCTCVGWTHNGLGKINLQGNSSCQRTVR